MRNRLIGAIGAASFALTTILATSTGASAFSGLSAKQKAHIDEYFMCKTLLLTDVAAFNATEPCGGTPSGNTASMADTKSGAAMVKEVEKPKHWKDKKRDKHHSRDKRDKHSKHDRRDRDSHNQCSSGPSSFSFGSSRAGGRSGGCNPR